MQMKNVNLLQNSEADATQQQHFSRPAEPSSSLAPPLPPRARANSATESSIHDHQSNCEDLLNDDDTSSHNISPYQSVPMPKPIPPPYRQPPAAASQYASVGYGVIAGGASSRLNNEPSIAVPGSSDPDPIYVTHSSKFPIRRELMRPQQHIHPHIQQSTDGLGTKAGGGGGGGGVGTSRIPHLSEVFRRQQQRARMANTVTPDTGVHQHSRTQQAWTRDADNKPHSADIENVGVRPHIPTSSSQDDGEPLLIKARSSTCPTGLDNYGADDTSSCYVPSQPHQRPVGSFARGQLLLERRPEAVQVSSHAGDNSLYRARFVTSGVEEPTAANNNSNASRIYESANCKPVRAIHSSMQNLKGSMMSLHSAAGRLQLDGGEAIYATRAEAAVLPPPQQFRGPSSMAAEVVEGAGSDSVQNGHQQQLHGARYYHLKDMLSGQSEGVSVDDDDDDASPTPTMNAAGASPVDVLQGQQQPADCNQATAKTSEKSGPVKRGAIYGLLRQIVMPSVKNIAQKFESCDESTTSFKDGVEDAAAVEVARHDEDQQTSRGQNVKFRKNAEDEAELVRPAADVKPALPARSSTAAEWTDTVEYELRQILDVKLQKPTTLLQHQPAQLTRSHGSIHESTFSDSFSVTPPLPPLSPPGTPPSLSSRSPGSRSNSKYRFSQSAGNLHKSSGTTPDILETTRKGPIQRNFHFKNRHGPAGGGAPTKSSSNDKSLLPAGTAMSDLHSSDVRCWTGGGSAGVKKHLHGALPHFRVPLTPTLDAATTTAATTYSGRMLRGSQISLGGGHGSNDGEVTSTTTGLDMDSLLGDGDLSTDASSQVEENGEMGNIRRQLESLETMYAEVMRMLGVKGGPRMGSRSLHDLRPSRRKGFGGSATSLSGGKGVGVGLSGRVAAAAATSTQPHCKEQRLSERKQVHQQRPRESKGIGRRFQRLESHVVTLARSVAHLSSEMRTQHLMYQEVDSLRQEVARLSERQQLQHQPAAVPHQGRGGLTAAKSNGVGTGGREWDNFRSLIPSLTNPTRVKKLTKFFGDEPPLLRLFLKKLGYEKYAPQFENEKIGIIELPYLTEDRLQKIGIPTGPRMRILQEAQMSFRQEHFNIYIV